MQNYGDNKAELYYKNNYGAKNKKSKNSEQNSSMLNASQDAPATNAKSLFSSTIRSHINNNSITQSILQEDSAIYKDFYDKKREGWNNTERVDGLTQLIDASKFSLKSGLVTCRSREDSVINKILYNLEGNILRTSINERIIDKLHKNIKKTAKNFSTTDKTKPEENNNVNSNNQNNNFRKNQSNRKNSVKSNEKTNNNPTFFKTINSNNSQNNNIVILTNNKVTPSEKKNSIKINTNINLNKNKDSTYIKKLFSDPKNKKYHEALVKSLSPNKIDEARAAINGFKSNLRYTVTVNEDRLNMKTPNPFKKTPPKTSISKEYPSVDKTEINKFKQSSKGDLVLTRKESGKETSLNSLKKASNSNGNLLINSYNCNPSLSTNKFNSTPVNNELKNKNDEMVKIKEDESVKVEPKRVSVSNSRNQVAPLKSTNRSSNSQFESKNRKTITGTLNKKSSIDSKKTSFNNKNVSNSESIQKVTLSLYIDNFSQNNFRSSYTNLKKSKNIVLQKSLSPSKTINMKRKDDVNNNINSSTIKTKSIIKDYNTHSLLKVSSISNEKMAANKKITTANSNALNFEKSSRNKSVGINRISGATECNYDISKRDNFRNKSKLFSSCSNIRSTNGKNTS